MLIDSWLMQARNNRPDVDSVPTLKHFFPMSETSGSIITDTKGGVVYTPTEISFATNMVRPHEPLADWGSISNIPAVPLTEGSWDVTGTDSFCLLAVGVLDSTGGDDTGGRILLGNDASTGDISPSIFAAIGDANAELSGGCNTGNTADDHYTARPTRGGVADGVEGNIFMLDVRGERTSSPGVVSYERWDETADTQEDESVSQPDGTGTSFENAAALVPDAWIAMRGLKLYGVALFRFSGAIPANYEQGALWMSWAWQQGYKTIWPNAVEWV